MLRNENFRAENGVSRAAHTHTDAYRSEADPGSVKRGGRKSKFLDAAPENNKNRPKGGGGLGRFAPLDPPLQMEVPPPPPELNVLKLDHWR